jgi:glutathione synthase/RimK-type ligase-like ATP-grasp enzyme
MSTSSPEVLLAALDAALATQPGQTELLHHRAALLAELGRTDEARQGYLAVLALDPTHFGALNDLGTLLYATDFRSAARLVYAEAVRSHPDNPVARINLANALLANEDVDEARLHYEAALRLAPDHPDAHQGLANLLQQLGDADAAELHRRQSYGGRGVLRTPYLGSGEPCRVLILASAAGGNVPTRFILDPALFETATLAVEACSPDTALPEHHVVFNAVGDADLSPAALVAAERILASTSAPVVNPPARVMKTGRAASARRLAGLHGVKAPKVEKVRREDVTARAAEIGFPLLLRSPGYHTGQHFTKVDHPDALPGALAGLPGRELLLIQYLDARDATGRSRKYRVMMIGGDLFPMHLAVSEDWKVHYFTSAMAEQPAYRAEEQAFLADMAAVVGPAAMSALEAICDCLALDYAGVDFGLAADGAVLLFEANATMVVNPPAPDSIWDYRRAPTLRILEAARNLVLARGGRT